MNNIKIIACSLLLYVLVFFSAAMASGNPSIGASASVAFIVFDVIKFRRKA